MSAPSGIDTTTGDRTLDRAIARFVYDPRSLRCDIKSDLVDYWRNGGCDGVRRRHTTPPWGDEHKGDTRFDALTRGELLAHRETAAKENPTT
jgi:hypothetical protein